MNRVTALRETIELWNFLACSPGVCKTEIPGPWCKYLSECPCCEYARTGVERKVYCGVCPMLKQWTCFDKFRDVVSYMRPNPCCFEYSPYWRWVQEMDLLKNEMCRLEAEDETDIGDRILHLYFSEENVPSFSKTYFTPSIPDYHSRPSKYDIEFFCLLIVELAEEALYELQEREGYMVE